MGAKDGYTALEVIRKQAAELKRPQDITSPSTGGETGEVSGGPPDRRCWCLAAEALGRAGMVKEVRVKSCYGRGTVTLFGENLSGRRSSAAEELPKIVGKPFLYGNSICYISRPWDFSSLCIFFSQE